MSHHFDVLLIPGSWHVPAHFASTVAELNSRGVSASSLLLPTCDISEAHILDLKHPDLAGPSPEKPWINMYDDAKAIQTQIRALVEAGKNVLLVAHSYGGLPTSEALTPELTFNERKKDGKKGGVIGLFAIASLFLPQGVSTRIAVGGDPLPTTPEQVSSYQSKMESTNTPQPSGLHTVTDPAVNLFNDLPEAEQKHWISLLRPQPGAVHESPAKNVGFLNLPCAYLKTLKDVVTPLPGQEAGIAFANQIRESAGVKIFGKIAEYEVDGGHSAFIGNPKSCVDSILDFGQKVQPQ